MKQEHTKQDGWKYRTLFKAERGGEEPIIVPALNEVDAAEQAAAHWGIGTEEMKENVVISEPTAAEILHSAAKIGVPLRFLIRMDGKQDLVITAYCREDAILQAANEWDAEYYELARSTALRIGVARRVPA